MSKTPERVDQLSSSQRLLLAMKEARAKLEASERAKTEPIAIIGMSCRFPGGANNPEAFWQLLRDGVDAVTEVPPERWDIQAYYDPDPDAPGKMYARCGGFLKQVDQFDPQFFNISPREALSLDPQQRLLLEVSWEALENAAQSSEQLTGSPTGVFVGITTNDYVRHLMQAGNSQIDAYFSTGNALNAAAGRLSYTLGFMGPSMAIDTACSSSLVAVHVACQSLRNGECRQALAGGVNLTLAPENTIALSKAKMMSVGGRCKTFDAEADGIVRGEGCGVIVLKRLSDAIADGDNILALIRGSAVNQDGPSSGLTVPNKTAQQMLIRQALSKAKVEPFEVDYVEAHGTGTPLGDPIEVRALGAALGEGRSQEHPLMIGSVKTNIGHLESAAGVAGLIKVVLALQHQQIPPHLHLKQLNPYVNWDELPVTVTTQPTPWLTGEKRRIAGISSFGASGTNAHVLIEEAPKSEPAPALVERPLHLLTLSAKTEEALKQLASRYKNQLTTEPQLAIADICFTANSGRSHFNHRLSLVAASSSEMCEKLGAFMADEEATGVFLGRVQGSMQPKVAFLFTGQGSQYVGMGRQLYDTQPTFRAALDRCDEILRPYLNQPLLEVLYPSNSESFPLDETAYTQPALFALEYALAQLWQSWGIEPAAVMGHSVGEYVAACVAGVFSLEDGLKLIAERGRLMQALPPDGAMVAVFADEARVNQAIKPYAQEVAIAAFNGSKSIVISGKRQALEAVAAALQADGIETKPLKVSHAFHSPLMEPMLTAFERVAKEVSYSPPQIDLISNVTGNLEPTEIATPDYWCRHIRQPVRFAAGMETLYQQGYKVFVEIGPHPVLLGMGRHCLPDTETTNFAFLPSLRRGQADWQQLLQSLGALYVRGVNANWSGFDQDYSRRRVVLPTYPFQRDRYWVEYAENGHHITTQLSRNGVHSKPLHPLLGHRLNSALKEIQFESQINQDSPAFLKHHCIYQNVILPATAYLEMALASGATIFKSDHLILEEIVIQQPLILPDNEDKTLQLVLSPEENSTYSFQIFSFKTDEEAEPSWLLHASGKVLVGKENPEAEQVDLASLPSQYSEEISLRTYYEKFQERGLDYGPSFQALEQLWRQDGKILGKIQLPEALVSEAGDYKFHPVILDACFQMLGAVSLNDEKQNVYLPVGLERLRIYRRPGTCLWSETQKLQIKGTSQKGLTADLNLYDETGTLVAQIEGLSIRRASRKALLRRLRKDLGNWLYQVTWQPQSSEHTPQPLPSEKPSSWLIFADNGGVGLKLANQLKEYGDRCVLVSAGSAYQKLEEEHYQINPADPLDFQRLFQAITGNHQPPYRGIVHLWSLTPPLEQELTFDALQDAQVLGCGSVLHLVQSLAAARWSISPRLWLVTKGAQAVGASLSPVQVQQAPLWGLGRAIAWEHPDLRCVRLDLDPSAEQDHLSTLLQELRSPDRDDQIAYRQGVRHVARLARHISSTAAQRSAISSEPFELKISSYGILENLTLVPMKRRPPGPGEVEIQVRATGLNFRDVLNALGMLQEYIEQLGIKSATDLPFGGECAGKIVAVGENVENFKVGDEVIAAQAIGSFSSFVTIRTEFVALKPSGLNFEEAATIPTTFLTAYYGLHHLANIKPGDRVLIHAAAGGVGQAAVQLAQQAGAQVFATASPSKWEFLKSMGVEYIMNSRTLDFAEEVMTLTQGQGVDIVLNSLNGEFIPKTLEVLGPGGRFIEIGKLGIWDENQVKETRSDVSYFPFDLLDISVNQPSLIAVLLEELMHEFQQGTLKPLPHKIFPIENVVSAFRYMAQAKHIGKVVVSQPEIATSTDSLDKELIREDSSYLITGGFGALGLKVAHWMVEQGARYLVLTGRRGASGTVLTAINQLERAGAKVMIVQADVSKPENVTRVLEMAKRSMPPLRGIIHAAGVLDDGVLLQQSWERFSRVMAPKVEGAWNLHQLTQNLPLDFFVCFSSISALLGSPGQGNYAAANAFMDALAHHRRQRSLPGLSINWGPWADAGMAAGLGSREQGRWAAQGVGTINPQQGLQVLREILGHNVAQVGVLPVDWSKFLGQFSEIDFPLLEAFLPASEESSVQPSEFLQQLEAAPIDERQPLLITHLRSQIAKVLGLSSSEPIDLQQGFSELGMDSLMAVELRNRLQTSLKCSIPSTLAFDYPTLDALVNYLIQDVLSIEFVSPSDTNSQDATDPVDLSAQLDELSQTEIADLLAQELAAIEEGK